MPIRLRAAIGSALIALVAVLVLGGCGSSSSPSSGGTSSSQQIGSGDDPLIVYSGRSEEWAGPALDAFSKKTGVPIDVRYGDSVDLGLLLGEEGDKTPAKVFLAQSSGPMVYLAQKNLLETLPQATLDRVPARFRADDGRWVGVTGRQRVLIYNTEQVTPGDLPKSVFDLTKPQYQGKVAVAPTNASFQDFIVAMTQLVGDVKTKGWLDGMAANDAKAYAKNDAIADAVARGEIPYGLVNHYYYNEIKEKDPNAPVGIYRFPGRGPGSVFLVSTAAITSAGGSDPRALQLINYMLSPAGQTVFVTGEGEYPVVVGVMEKSGQLSLSQLKYPSYDLSNVADLKQTALLIQQSGIGG